MLYALLYRHNLSKLSLDKRLIKMHTMINEWVTMGNTLSIISAVAHVVFFLITELPLAEPYRCPSGVFIPSAQAHKSPRCPAGRKSIVAQLVRWEMAAEEAADSETMAKLSAHSRANCAINY